MFNERLLDVLLCVILYFAELPHQAQLNHLANWRVTWDVVLQF